MSLEGLRDSSVAVIKSAIQHPLGLIKLPASGEVTFTPKEQRLLELNRELDVLSRQIVEARESTGLAEKRSSRLVRAEYQESGSLEKLGSLKSHY
jgi:hypothetical protein